jgi:4-hydroxybenzoate polyprenyltransferase
VKNLLPFLQLIRFKNLVFIAICQFFFYFFIIKNHATTCAFSNFSFIVIVIIAVAIAAAGNIINDYFDLKIDLVNKPNDVIIDRYISKKTSFFCYIILNCLAFFLSFYIAYSTHYFLIFIANCFSILLLFLYAKFLKKTLLFGNILVSFLTVWVLLILAAPPYWYNKLEFYVFKIGCVYSIFCFALSMAREITKDIEDIEGDVLQGCKTVPIVWGSNAAKNIVVSILCFVVIILAYCEIVLLNNHQYFLASFSIIFISMPTLFCIVKIKNAVSKTDFTHITKLLKFIMIMGIATMLGV